MTDNVKAVRTTYGTWIVKDRLESVTLHEGTTRQSVEHVADYLNAHDAVRRVALKDARGESI